MARDKKDKTPTLRNTFDALKRTIIGTKTAEIDSNLDKAVKDIIAYKTHSSNNSYVELIKNIINKNASSAIDLNSLGGESGLFGNTTTTPESFGQSKRLGRYSAYEGITYKINYCYRALQVLVENIISPDDITKVALDVHDESFSNDNEDTIKQVSETIKLLKIEKNLHRIVLNTLKLGDFFGEIADSKTAVTSKSILSEMKQSLVEQAVPEYADNPLFETTEIVESITMEDGITSNVILNYESLIEANSNKERTVDDVTIIYHDPSQVVKLQSDLFPVCFGYLVFPKNAGKPTQFNLEDMSVNNICVSILKSLEKRIPSIKDLKNDDDLKGIIQSMIQSGAYNKNINIRYVPSDKMVHFHRPSTLYFPYGESIFSSCEFSAKLLIALETALVVQRINRSTEKRKIMVEAGLTRDGKRLVNSIKEEFKKRKVSIDSMGSVDTIPSMITTFEDIYIPQKDGKPFVDIQTFNEGNVDVRSKVDELKMLRDQLVASLSVPPSFIGIEENLSNKSALTEENILFARTIIYNQKYITEQLNELVEKVYMYTNPDDALTILDNISISLQPPKSLQYERESRYISDLANLVRTLDEIGVPKEWSKRKYMTNIDWDEVDNFEIDEKIDTSLGTSEEDDQGGGLGGAGGGMY